ncbi:MAG: guanitoxin biosynthesis heme-dependent pre-guanitoxin N-hydroxylase GntA [Ginsengibacter sp.]
MEQPVKENIIEDFYSFIRNESFPCVGAKAALTRNNIRVMVAEHFDRCDNDQEILSFAYNFIEEYRKANSGFHSLVIIFKDPVDVEETLFDEMMWRRLQSLRDLDAIKFTYDRRVSSDPTSPSFSFSLMEEAFFIIALHPFSSRLARRFSYPALVFNPHAQFEKLRRTGIYERIKKINRVRDIRLCGSINPMLKDFGESSEVFQYSGRQYNDQWKCPLK